MKYTYHYEFHPHGTTVSKSDRLPSHIWVDNGNLLDIGIFDHHQNPQYNCSVEVLYENSHLLVPLGPDENNSFTFHTHIFPDTDALFSIFLIQYYLEHRETVKEGAGSNQGFPLCASQILSYVKTIDSGRIRLSLDNRKPLMSLYCILTCLFKLESDMTKATQRALTIISHAVSLADNASPEAPFDFFYSPVSNIDCHAELTYANEDYDKYLADKASICQITKCALPLENETISEEKVDTLIWKGIPSSQFNRLWAREEGYALTIIPVACSAPSFGEKEYSCTNVIISLDPFLNDKRENAFSLLPIARYLETYEQMRENTLFSETKLHKRDHSAPRGYRENRNSLFLKPPFCETSDPWFINADGTLIGAPRTGSLLSLEDIVQTVTSFSAYCLKCIHSKLIIPFCFQPQKLPRLSSVFSDQSLPVEASHNLPFLRRDLRYLNTMVSEFSYNKENYSHFVLPLQDRLLQTLQMLDSNYLFADSMDAFLFPYGIGFFILSVARECSCSHVPTFIAMEVQKEFCLQVDNFFRTTLITDTSLLYKGLDNEAIRMLNPHYYTYMKLSPENAAITDSALSRYAAMLCSISSNAENDCETVCFNYRQHMAYSRIGCAFVSTSHQQEDSLCLLFEKEWFWLYLLILEQRYVLLECKRALVQFKLHQHKEIKKMYEMLIDFSASGYFSTAVDDERGDSIYRGISEKIFMLSSLKDEVQNQLEQVASYHESRVNASLDKISVWILPFMVLSTILQCSLITMEPLIRVSKKGFPFALTSNIQAFASWGIVVFLIVLLFVLLKITNKRRK